MLQPNLTFLYFLICLNITFQVGKTQNIIAQYCFRGNLVLLERIVSLEKEEAYSELKTILLEKGCKIVSEEPPKHISVKHGSLRGVSPISAKKLVSYHIFSHESGTRIVTYSSISSDWVSLTFGGSMIAGFVAAMFWWIAYDISSLVINGEHRFWTWLARAFGYPDLQYTFFMINVIKLLAIVLVATIIFEVLDFSIVYRKINTFAEETLDLLAEK